MDVNSKIAGDTAAAPKTTSIAAAAEGGVNSTAEVSSNANSGGDAGDTGEGAVAKNGSESVWTRAESRTPFTNLSQVDFGEHEYDDEDDDDDEEDEEDGNPENHDEEEDAFDIHGLLDPRDNDAQRAELDTSAFPNDERALQDAEEREMAARLLDMAGITEREIVDVEEDEVDEDISQDTREEFDPYDLLYEELIALGELLGAEGRGLSADAIASLQSTNYKSQNTSEAEDESCVICRLEYEDDDALTTLPCKHVYHSKCINKWLNIDKTCPVCSAEVSASGNS